MKLYIQDDEVYFDYSDVNFDDTMAQATLNYRGFMLDCECGWEPTLKPRVKRMEYKPFIGATPYGNACKLRRLVGSAYYKAIYLPTIEVSDDVKKFLDEIEEKCNNLREVEIAKQQALEAERKWKDVCKFGCGSCANKSRCGDDFICMASGDLLPEKNVPKPHGKVYQLFNYTPFPTENCPLNINKNEEKVG